MDKTLSFSRLKRLIPLLRFLAVGGLNTFFGYGLYALLIWMGLPLALAVLLSTVGGVLFNFVTYGRLAMGSPITLKILPRFLAVYGIAYGINVGLLKLLVYAGLSPYLAALVLLPFNSLAMFFALRKFVFVRPKA